MKPTSQGNRRTVKFTGMAAAAALALAVAGCDAGPKSARGFRLPDGDAARGRAAFVALKCYACHQVQGADVPPPLATVQAPVPLGGEVTRLRTYGDLVTSIINPSHRISDRMKKEWMRADGKSPMPVINETMTVAQMIDLVAFLQPLYREIPLDDRGTYPGSFR
jgi:mono/diheme cytochrome c family protein